MSNTLTIKRTFLLFFIIVFVELAGNLIAMPFTLLSSKDVLFNELVISNLLRLLDFLIIYIFIIYVWKGTYKDLGFSFADWKNNLKWAIYFALGLGVFVITAETCSLIIYKEDLFKYLIDDSLPINNLKYMSLYFFTAGFSAVIIEELVFRQILYKSLRSKFNVVISIFFTSIFFAFLHFYDLYYSIIPLLGGILFAVLYEKTGNLTAPIILHSSGNLVLTVLTIIYKAMS